MKTLVSLFNEVVIIRSATLLKRDSNISVFQWKLRNLKEQLFYRTPLVDATETGRKSPSADDRKIHNDEQHEIRQQK